MGATCSKCHGLLVETGATIIPGRRRYYYPNGDPNAVARSSRQDSPDPAIYDLMRRSVACSTMAASATAAEQQQEQDGSSPTSSPAVVDPVVGGQHHLLYKHQRKEKHASNSNAKTDAAALSSPQKETNPTMMQEDAEDQDHSSSSSSAGSNKDSDYDDDNSQRVGMVDNKKKTHLPPTRLLVRRHSLRHYEEGLSGTHIYAIRYPNDQPLLQGSAGKENSSSQNAAMSQEQAPQHAARQQQQHSLKKRWIRDKPYTIPTVFDKDTGECQVNIDQLFRPSTMAAKPKQQVLDWVTVSQEHSIYIADVGLTPAQCNQIVQVTEQVCRGNYAAYTYAKQTLGCREYPTLAAVCQPAIHTMTNFILEFSQKQEQVRKEKKAAAGTLSSSSSSSSAPTSTTTTPTTAAATRCLALDDREPHMVKYDVTKKERQKLDMHTDKSEWTFLIALSNGSGMDYEGGGTYFECLDATIHIQRGHALCFPGKLRHCGQRITSGLRFLLVAFLVDKSTAAAPNASANNSNSTKEITTAGNSSGGDKKNSSAAAASGAAATKSSTAAKSSKEDDAEEEDDDDDLAYRTA